MSFFKKDQTIEETQNVDEEYVADNHKRRIICDRCRRPSPKACICAALPSSPISLSKCRILCLIHPLELPIKNRSLPLIELCLDRSHDTDDKWIYCNQVGRRFHLNSFVMNHFHGTQGDQALLVFPSPDAISLSNAIQLTQQRHIEQGTCITDRRITLIFIDATWKYAKQIEQACSDKNIWPKNLIRVKLSAEEMHQVAGYRTKRFHIRTPPSENHLSTAESIAVVVSLIEDNSNLYHIFMKPLDLMVEQWRA